MTLSLFKRNQWIYWFFARFFPKGMKRKIVMIAAFCEIERKRGVKNPRICKLNRALKLTQTDQLLFGIRDVATPLSETFLCDEKDDVCDVAAVCNSLTDSVPEYLIYDTRENIISDIAKVMVCNLN